MRKPFGLLLATGFAIAACGGWQDARVNPRNWFGKSRSTNVATPANPDTVNPLIPQRSAFNRRREPVDESVAIAALSALKIERTNTGAMILVTGLASRQGAFEVELRPDPANEETPSDTLSYTMRVVYPDFPTTVGSEHSRTIHAAQSLTNQDLRGIRLVRVTSAQNVLESRRR